MVKTLTRHGNSYALIIDKPILDLLNITPDSQLEVSTDGKVLVITPVGDQNRRARVRKAVEKTNRRYGRALKKLAE